MTLDAQRLAGADLCRLGTGGVTLLLHHQKTPAPKIAMRIIPTMVSRSAQRIASRAMRTKIARMTTPAMMKMVVKSMAYRRRIIFHISFHIFDLSLVVAESPTVMDANGKRWSRLSAISIDLSTSSFNDK
jgi:hypothetical protein